MKGTKNKRSLKQLCLGIILNLGFNQIAVAQTSGNGVTDIDGNTYSTVIIGTQEWMAENLRTCHYSTGELILNVTDSLDWANQIQGAWAYYNNDSTKAIPYGKLYNWYAADTTKQLCPDGWRVPSDEDWDTLRTFLGGTWEAGGKIKEAGIVHWNSPNTGATNQTGFTALPGGSREGGAFDDMGEYGYYWSTWDDHPTSRHRWELRHTQTILAEFNVSRDDGYSVRCIKSTVVSINETEESHFLFFPNPTSSFINIRVSKDIRGIPVQLIDGRGRIVKDQTIEDEIIQIDMRELDSGLYLLKVGDRIHRVIKKR